MGAGDGLAEDGEEQRNPPQGLHPSQEKSSWRGTGPSKVSELQAQLHPFLLSRASRSSLQASASQPVTRR